MAIRITNKSISVASTNRTQVYKAPDDQNCDYAVIFSGTVTNTSLTKEVVFVTIEHRSGDVYKKIGQDVAVPYGISPMLPKITLKPDESLYITSNKADSIDVFVSVLVN